MPAPTPLNRAAHCTKLLLLLPNRQLLEHSRSDGPAQLPSKFFDRSNNLPYNIKRRNEIPVSLAHESRPKLPPPILSDIFLTLVDGPVSRMNVVSHLVVENFTGWHVANEGQFRQPSRPALRNVVHVEHNGSATISSQVCNS